MEASALRQQSALPHLGGRSPLLRLQSDEKLVAMIRRGNNSAFDALVQRYQPRLLAFCRHMLGSQEDAEDVLQEVFAASFNALLADDRPINARPWLYRIARNRCLNHLRRPRAAGQDSMDIFETEHGTSTAETVHRREEFRQIVADVQELPETQRTALLLREIDALSYDQIAEAMDTTVPSVKSLLVRARVGLAEASEARLLTCEEVRVELAEVAEGLSRTTAPARRHLKNCERCRTFRSELKTTTKALAAVLPIGPLIFFKKLGIAHLGFGGGTAAGSVAAGSRRHRRRRPRGRRRGRRRRGGRRRHLRRRRHPGLQGRRRHGRRGDRHRGRRRGQPRGQAQPGPGPRGGPGAGPRPRPPPRSWPSPPRRPPPSPPRPRSKPAARQEGRDRAAAKPAAGARGHRRRPRRGQPAAPAPAAAPAPVQEDQGTSTLPPRTNPVVPGTGVGTDAPSATPPAQQAPPDDPPAQPAPGSSPSPSRAVPLPLPLP